MGNFIRNITPQILPMVVLLFVCSLVSAQNSNKDTPSLGESFNAGAPEVEPVVVGRDRWNEKPITSPIQPPDPASTQSENNLTSPSTRIGELDPLETQQIKPDSSTLPLEPPKNKPATQIVRNFEGTLVFKPRNFGFANKFPYQLENSNGKHLAFIDVNELKAVDPQQFVDKQINVMGKLDSLAEGSDDRVIRARVIRPSN